jgi:hypothetical protein
MNTCQITRQSHYTQPTVTVIKEDDPTTSLYRAAEKRAKAKLGFYIHAMVFVFVNAMQFGINLFTTPLIFWSFFPFLGWGLGLAIHGLVVWFKTSELGEWMVEEELEKLQGPQITEFPMTSSVTVTEKPGVNQR